MLRQLNVKVGDAAPAFTLRKLNGSGTVSLSQFKGKFVLLDFWASWCPPCRALTPVLKKIYARFGISGKLVIISITFDTDLKWPRKFVAAKKLPWIQVVAGSDARHSIADDYTCHGIPSLFLIGPDGKLISSTLDGQNIESIIAARIARTPTGPAPTSKR